jgi:hypothetical protein
MNEERHNSTLDNFGAEVEDSYAARMLTPMRPQANTEGGPSANEIELAWAAGFLDGEGCISVVWQRFHLTKRRATVRIRLQIVQNNLQVLKRLNKILGEKCCLHEMKRLLGHNRQIYTLNIDGENALNAIIKVYPYLFRKKEEAEVLIAAIKSCWFGIRPGRCGYPDHVWSARERLVSKLQALK